MDIRQQELRQQQQQPSKQLIVYSYAVLNPSVKNIITPKIQIQLNYYPKWLISKPNRQKWIQLFQNMTQSTVQLISISNIFKSNLADTSMYTKSLKYQQHSMLKSLSYPNFISLKQLDLSTNNINNMEPIAFLCMPQIHDIDLNGNYITNTKSINKSYFKNLQKFNLGMNKLIINQQISRFYVNKLIFDAVIGLGVNTQYFQDMNQQLQISTLYHFFKAQCLKPSPQFIQLYKEEEQFKKWLQFRKHLKILLQKKANIINL